MDGKDLSAWVYDGFAHRIEGPINCNAVVYEETGRYRVCIGEAGNCLFLSYADGNLRDAKYLALKMLQNEWVELFTFLDKEQRSLVPGRSMLQGYTPPRHSKVDE